MSDKTLIEWNADVGHRFLTIHPDGSFDIDKDAPPLFVIGELAKAFIRQQDRIKRLEEAGDGLLAALKDDLSEYVEWINESTDAVGKWNRAKESKQ